MSNTIIDINASYGTDGQNFLITGDKAIGQALNSMLTTQVTSRFMRPELASPLWKHLFRSMNKENAHMLMVTIFGLIASAEPRIIVNKKQCRIIGDRIKNSYEILISYEIVATRQLGSITFSLQGQ